MDIAPPGLLDVLNGRLESVESAHEIDLEDCPECILGESVHGREEVAGCAADDKVDSAKCVDCLSYHEWIR